MLAIPQWKLLSRTQQNSQEGLMETGTELLFLCPGITLVLV
jgi:hypothetical protein